MSDNKELHWAEDDDLLSRFVLGRLPAEEKKKLEAHLVSCFRCREMVEKERNLVSGIRQFGREDVKARLKNRLAAKSVSSRALVTWQRAISAAAVVVIITGVGVFSHWFSWGEDRGPASTKFLEKTTQPVSGEADSSISQNIGAQSESRNAPEKSSRNKEAHENTQILQFQAQQNPAEARRTKPLLDERINGVQNLSGATSSGAGAISLKKDLENQQDQVATENPNAQTFWVEGRVLNEQQHSTNSFNALKKAAAPNRNTPESRQSLKAIDRQQPMRNILDREGITIRQESIQVLPSTRQTMQREDGDKVQMKVEQTDQGTNMTMYLDKLFDKTNLKNASIEQVTPDSIVIEVESRIIGFKMPIDLLELQRFNQKAKRR